jgi:hypothetical protein
MEIFFRILMSSFGSWVIVGIIIFSVFAEEGKIPVRKSEIVKCFFLLILAWPFFYKKIDK